MSHNLQKGEAVILSAVRTPSGRFQGSLGGFSATQLGAIVVKAAVERAGISDSGEIDEVLMGNVVSAGLGQAPARQAAIFAGLPASVGATTINKVCGSGLKTVMIAAQAIRAGDGSLFVTGGMESMSRVPYLVDGRTGELRFGHARLTDALLKDGLWDPFEDWGMGDAAEFIAQEYQVTREAMDEFAYNSHKKAIAAIDGGKFKAVNSKKRSFTQTKLKGIIKDIDRQISEYLRQLDKADLSENKPDNDDKGDPQGKIDKLKSNAKYFKDMARSME